jgi:hypothetical protein
VELTRPIGLVGAQMGKWLVSAAGIRGFNATPRHSGREDFEVSDERGGSLMGRCD